MIMVPTEVFFLADSNAITIIDDTPVVEQGPFSDPPRNGGHQSKGSLSAVIEEATKRALGEGKKDSTPFGDEHEVKE